MRRNVSVQRTEASAEISQVLSQLDPTDDPQMLGRLGGYEVSGVVGSGGMGLVSSAAYVDKVIYIGNCDGLLRALDANCIYRSKQNQ